MGRIPETAPEVKPIISLKSDHDYLSAVKRGDRETVQRMVDDVTEHAMPESKVRNKRTGKLRPVYHRSGLLTITAFASGNPSKGSVSDMDERRSSGETEISLSACFFVS